jgi:hypothetical protein
MDLFELFNFIVQIVSYLVYGAIVVHFFSKKDNDERIKFLTIVIGLFAILFLSEAILPIQNNQVWPFTFKQMIIMGFLTIAGVDLLIGKTMAAVLFIIYLLAFFTTTFFSFAAAAITYIIVSYGFIYSAFKIIQSRFD